MIYIIMGVSGCGKSALGAVLSEKLGWPLHEGDHFHPQGNIEKMARGEPLTDQFDGAVLLHHCKFSSPSLSRDASLVDDAELNARISVDVLKTPVSAFSCFLRTDCRGFSNYMKSLRGRCSRSDALVACSALKRLYRQILLYGSKALDSSSGPDHDILPPTPPDVFFLFLHGDYDLIQQRMVARRGHYMKADLLRSQFDVLEPPSDEENVLPLAISRSVTDMAVEVQAHIVRLKSST